MTAHELREKVHVIYLRQPDEEKNMFFPKMLRFKDLSIEDVDVLMNRCKPYSNVFEEARKHLYNNKDLSEEVQLYARLRY